MHLRRVITQMLPPYRHQSNPGEGSWKSHLQITQTGSQVVVGVELSSHVTAERLWAHSPESGWKLLGDFRPVKSSNEAVDAFETNFRLDTHDAIPVVSDTVGLFFEVTALGRYLLERSEPTDERPTTEELAASSTRPMQARVALARFTTTQLNRLEPYSAEDGTTFLLYPLPSAQLALSIGELPAPRTKVHIDHARIEDGQLRFRGTMHAWHSRLESSTFVLEGRDTGAVISAPFHLVEEAEHAVTQWGHRRYQLSAAIPLTEFIDQGRGDDVFTVWAVSKPTYTDEKHRARIGVSRYAVRRRTNEAWAEKDDRAVLVSPYYTFKAKNLSLNVEFFDTDQLRQMLAWVRMPRSRPTRRVGEKPVWLIGEQSYKAQDNGLAFFRYMREKHPEVDAYYVISEDSPDRANLADSDHVVTFRSREHIELFFAAERIIGSHHPDYLYPSKSTLLKGAVDKVLVFLQHGVFGVRRLDKLYGRRALDFHTDLFIVSSEREKRNAITDLGYRPSEVAVTGLARFDSLFDNQDGPLKGRILVMPTWREWLQSERAFVGSEYHRRWSDLMQSPRFLRLLDKEDAHVLLHLHPNMRMFAEHFAHPRIQIVHQGEEPVQRLLKESAILITDYSSVGFDFAFLKKSVLYYQFDSERFLGGASHIDLDTELPGPVLWSQTAVLDELEEALHRDGRIRPEHSARVDDLLAYRDTNNNERIFAAVARAHRRSAALPERHAEAAQAAQRIAQTNQRYSALMRLLFKLLRLLPLRDDIVVFESSQPSHAADIPQAIYEELVRRGDSRTKIWVDHGDVRAADVRTRIVDRSSPSFFWYRARAKYWIADRHFTRDLPHRRKAVRLQAGRGTPLNVSEVQRAYAADGSQALIDGNIESARQWTHLVSPSPFATQVYADAFHHQAEVLESGNPRLDGLNASDRDEIAAATRRKLGIQPARRTLLVAPAGEAALHRLTAESIEKLADALGTKHVVLTRMPSSDRRKLDISAEYTDRVIDVTRYARVEDLLLASDALVTEISPLLFDYAVLDRPIIVLESDLEETDDTVHGGVASELPGPVVADLADVPEALYAEDEQLTDHLPFLRRFAPHEDGHAARRVVDRLFDTH